MISLDDITEKVLSEHLLSDAEEHALAEAVQQKGSDCPEMEKLYEVYGCIVEAVAQQYIKNDIPYEDLLFSAKQGFEGAIKRYHSTTPLAHFIVWDIRRSIHAAMAAKVVANKS